MFNSPAPRQTPRRGVNRPRESVSLSRGTPSIFSDQQDAQSIQPNRYPIAPLTPSIRGSRLAVARGLPPSPTSSAGETIRTARAETDSYERVIWAKNDRTVVSSAGGLPKEVQSIIKQSDMMTTPVSGHLDTASGFAFITTSTACIAWNYQKRTQASPTCYTFPGPAVQYGSTNSQFPLLASLFTSSSTSSAEPGMIVVSAYGEVRLWETMGMGLANMDRYQYSELPLAQGDFTERIWRVESNTFIVTTATSQALRLTVGSQSGRAALSITQFTKSGGIFGRASNTIFAKESDRSGVQAVATPPGSGSTYILAGRTLQRWALPQGSQRLNQEFDLFETIGSELFDDWAKGTSTMSINDIATYGHDELAALVSYTENQSSSRSQHHSFAIVIFSTDSSSDIPVISRMIPVSHTSAFDQRALDNPRLVIPFGGQLGFIRLANVVVTVSMAADDEYEDTITLKDASRNAFIGLGYKSVPVTTRRLAGSPVVLMPALGGLLGVDVVEPANGAGSSSMSASTAALKSRMEQAVFYGDRSENPLVFNLTSDSGGDVAEAAERVSREILSSTSTHAPALFELKPQLLDRYHRLRELIAFIRQNKLLHLVSQSSRRKLSADAEKAKASIELWEHQDRNMAQSQSRSPQSLLADGIAMYIEKQGLSGQDDVVRYFFRTQAPHLDKLLDVVYGVYCSSIESLAKRSEVAGWVYEVNRIFLNVYRAAAQYREDHRNTYEIDRLHPLVEQWTAKASLVDALESLYNDTKIAIEGRTRELGSIVDEASETSNPSMKKEKALQRHLKDQLAFLAAALCENMEDKLRTRSTREEADGTNPQDAIALKSRYLEMKPRIIRPLAHFDKLSEAFELAENHFDYPSLVWLCYTTPAGQDANRQARVETYIERYGEDFAFVLYQWFIDNDRSKELMTQDEVYGALVTKFFEVNDYPQLAWMHHIACKRYGQAAISLIAVDGQTQNLSEKHLVDSIGKLAAVAQIKAKGASAEHRQILDDLDDGLELVGVQNGIRDALLVASDRSANPLGEYVKEHASYLNLRPALKELFVSIGQRLIDGESLNLEDLIDVLTLKDNTGISVSDSTIALDRLVKDESLPDGRKQVALLSIWRRVFIRDDWLAIANTSGRSDEGQRALIRGTLSYHTIRAISSMSDFPTEYILSPYTASQAPLPVELVARFPEWSTDQIEGLMRDHQAEIEVLTRYLTEADLETRVKEVSELVRRDVSEGLEVEEGSIDGGDVDGDVSM